MGYDKLAPSWTKALFDVRSPFTNQAKQLGLQECCSSDSWLAGTDNLLWELSPNAATQILSSIPLHSHILYMSVATSCTVDERPLQGTFPLLRPLSRYLSERHHLPKNDGLVPLGAQRAPPAHRCCSFEFGGIPQRCMWNVIQMQADHFSFYSPQWNGQYPLLSLVKQLRFVVEQAPSFEAWNQEA